MEEEVAGTDVNVLLSLAPESNTQAAVAFMTSPQQPEESAKWLKCLELPYPNARS